MVFTYIGVVLGPSAFSVVVAAGGYDGAFYPLAGLTVLAGEVLPRGFGRGG